MRMHKTKRFLGRT